MSKPLSYNQRDPSCYRVLVVSRIVPRGPQSIRCLLVKFAVAGLGLEARRINPCMPRMRESIVQLGYRKNRRELWYTQQCISISVTQRPLPPLVLPLYIIHHLQGEVCRFRRWGTGHSLPSISIRQSIVSETPPREICLLDNLLQAAHETVHRTQSVSRLFRTVFERGEGDRCIVYDHTDLITWAGRA